MASNKKNPVVILVHGIRTHAHWHEEIKSVLMESGFHVVLTNYGRFDLFRFLAPFEYFRNKAKNKVFTQFRAAKMKHKGAKFSVIAHSFGSYIVARILQDEFDIKLDKIIFVGSVVRYDFPFEQFSGRFSGDILNEVGFTDPFPVLAESITTGYGKAGTYGFRVPHVVDRYHDGSHSDILNGDHCSKYWVDFLRARQIHKIDCRRKGPPFWINLLSILKIKYFIVFLIFLLALLVTSVSLWASNNITYRFYAQVQGWNLNNAAKSINQEINKPCPIKLLFGDKCDYWLAEKITKRKWYSVRFFDSAVKDVVFCDNFYFSSTDPADFWLQLNESFPNCLKIEVEESYLTIKLADNISQINGQHLCGCGG